jgi:hypothetical protein
VQVLGHPRSTSGYPETERREDELSWQRFRKVRSKKIEEKIGFFLGNIENRPSLRVFLMIFSPDLCSDLCFWC